MNTTDIQRKVLSQPKDHSSVESRAIYYAVISGILTLLVGLAYFGYFYDGTSAPLFGRMSIGSLSIVAASLLAFFGYLYVMYQGRQFKKTSKLRVKFYSFFDMFALSFIHATIVFLVTSVAFYVLSGAFIGVNIDIYLANVIAAVTTTATSYVVYLAASNRTAVTMSMALAVFLVAGTLTSMITANDPKWWELHLSSLGANGGISMYAFNGTLIIGGIVIAGIANQIAKDFVTLQSANNHYKRVKVGAVRWTLVLVGLFLAGVGLFPYDTMPTLHEISAGGMVFLFLFLIGGLQFLVPMFSRAFFAVSYALLIAVLLSTYLFMGISYFNLTGYEIICFIILFTWLVMFVRQVAASLHDSATSS